jgi:ribulose-5-phosphate 4-epimerase/fuculose-1-phosphate aldolase
VGRGSTATGLSCRKDWRSATVEEHGALAEVYLPTGEGASGHLTSRDLVDPSSFWVNPYGLHFSLMTSSDLLLVSHAGVVLSGGHPSRQKYNAAAWVIHSAIHSARPDVQSVVHPRCRGVLG